ncbi:MAG: RimK family alpha-L-glutamate ligase [Mycobacteriales bacterium]
MTLRVGLATCAAWPELDEDGPELVAALAAAGLDVDVPVWDDPAVDWDGYDLVVIRCTWDYWDRRDDYLAWARGVPRLANDANVVEWNTDKSYLRRLAEAGIPVVPTTWIQPGEPFAAPDHPFVVKPSVSAGARDTAAYEPGDTAAAEHVMQLLAAGKTVMVQPYVAAVEDAGETSVLVFDGKVSHGARKSAVLTKGAGEAELGSWTMSAREPAAEEVALAEQVVEVVRGWGDELLYARADILPGPVIVELEVTEPSLFLRHAPGSAARYAKAVRAWTERASSRR